MRLDPNGKVVVFLTHPEHRIAADVVPVLSAFYFTFKKVTDYSLETDLDQFIKPAGVDVLIGIVLAIIFYCCLLKVAHITIDQLCKVQVKFDDYASFLQLYKKNNLEIEEHLRIIEAAPVTRSDFERFHTYTKNIQFLLYSLNQHLLPILQSKGKIRQRDLCISFFCERDSNGTTPPHGKKGRCYDLVAHYEPSSFEIKTVEIWPEESEFEEWAGVKALQEGKPIHVANGANGEFVKTGNKTRRKTVKHYWGVPMSTDGRCVGLLNIEIHNKELFASKAEMEEFYSSHLYGFRCLLEYQLLKRRFFRQLSPRIIP